MLKELSSKIPQLIFLNLSIFVTWCQICVLSWNVTLHEQCAAEVSSCRNYAGSWTFTPLLLECLQCCSQSWSSQKVTRHCVFSHGAVDYENETKRSINLPPATKQTVHSQNATHYCSIIYMLYCYFKIKSDSSQWPLSNLPLKKKTFSDGLKHFFKCTLRILSVVQ